MDEDFATTVFDHYFELRRHYGQVPVKCVIHDDAHASASVNLDEGVWFCMVCDEGGTAMDLIKKVEGLGYRDAKRFAETTFGTNCEQVRGTVDEEPDGYGLPKRKRDQPRSGRWLPSWRLR